MPAADIDVDAKAGTLPAVSIALPSGPTGQTSQHNIRSMIVGDNWMGQVISHIMAGPQWASTAIFITYDDCGCLYDHVAPSAVLGPRVPMVIISPYAKAGYTDSNTATQASPLAFLEHTFSITPLNTPDGTAYDYAGVFDYTQTPTAPITLRQHPVPPSSDRYLREHMTEEFEDDT